MEYIFSLCPKSYSNKNQDAMQGFTVNSKIDISFFCCEDQVPRLPFRQKWRNHTYSEHTCGSMENSSIGESIHFKLFICDYSQITYFHFVRNQHETCDCFRKIKISSRVNGNEFYNSNLMDAFVERV